MNKEEDCFHPEVVLSGILISIDEHCVKIEVTEICRICNTEVDEYIKHYYSGDD